MVFNIIYDLAFKILLVCFALTPKFCKISRGKRNTNNEVIGFINGFRSKMYKSPYIIIASHETGFQS